jgi:hypothetical protein
LFQEAVFFEGELMELVTEGLVMAEGFRWRHERLERRALERRGRTAADRY